MPTIGTHLLFLWFFKSLVINSFTTTKTNFLQITQEKHSFYPDLLIYQTPYVEYSAKMLLNSSFQARDDCTAVSCVMKKCLTINLPVGNLSIIIQLHKFPTHQGLLVWLLQARWVAVQMLRFFFRLIAVTIAVDFIKLLLPVTGAHFNPFLIDYQNLILLRKTPRSHSLHFHILLILRHFSLQLIVAIDYLAMGFLILEEVPPKLSLIG